MLRKIRIFCPGPYSATKSDGVLIFNKDDLTCMSENDRGNCAITTEYTNNHYGS